MPVEIDPKLLDKMIAETDIPAGVPIRSISRRGDTYTLHTRAGDFTWTKPAAKPKPKPKPKPRKKASRPAKEEGAK